MNYGDCFEGKDFRAVKEHAYVVQVAVGQNHALLLTDEGVIYSWGGKSDSGQLGREPDKKSTARIPSPVASLAGDDKNFIVQIACGADHCLAVGRNGTLWSWGSNQAGQLGVASFDKMAPKETLIQKLPVIVWKFDGSHPAVAVRSCSCGPESSSCVTVNGDVYVWGAAGYYFVKKGAGFRPDECCFLPAKLRGMPNLSYGRDSYRPDHITLSRRRLVCTISRDKLQEELELMISSLKRRQQMLTSIRRQWEKNSKEKNDGGDAEVEMEDLKNMKDDWRVNREKCTARLKQIESERKNIKGELERIGRELTVYDQQDTALTEEAVKLEVKKSEKAAESRQQAGDRQLDHYNVKLNDIGQFKQSNRKTKMGLLELRDRNERKLWAMTQEMTEREHEAGMIDSRLGMLKMLQRSDFGRESNASVDEGLQVAVSKHAELEDTDPERLAGVGVFTGFREVLAISDRALMDVQSALKEVSAVVTGGDGEVLEEVLEYNVKLRRQRNQSFTQIMQAVEAKPPPPSDKAGRSRAVEFFMEAAIPGDEDEDPRPEDGARRRGSGGARGAIENERGSPTQQRRGIDNL